VSTIARESGAYARKFGNDVETGAVLETHVDDGEGRRLVANEIDPFLHRMCEADFEPSQLHGARKALQERAVVIDDHELSL
jgi:hypothetical protein